MFPEFRETYGNDQNYLVSGKLLNKQAEALNKLQGQLPPGHQGLQHGHIRNVTARAPFRMGLAVIIDASDKCDYDE